MKARNRKTGEIVTIVAYSGRVDRNDILDYVYYVDSNGKEHTEDGRGLNLYWDFETEIEIEIENPSINKTIVDWKSFRREAAKDILCVLIGREGLVVRQDKRPGEIEVTDAICFADELIRLLKENSNA